MEGLVSVIIPVYNRQEYIEECISSVLAQSYQNFEIIIIDDGSTDDSLKICMELTNVEPRIRLLNGDHKGVSAARNIGLDASQGEFVFFVDSDDVIHPRLLETLVKGLQQHGVHMGGTKGINVLHKNWQTYTERLYSSTEAGEVIYKSFDETLRAMFTEQTPFSVMGGVIMRRDWIGDTRYKTNLSIGEDYLFSYENLIKGTGAVFLKQRWYLNRIHNGNTSWDYSYTGFMTRFLRRKLVWESEESFGRIENANRQKIEIPGIYFSCVKRAGVFSTDGKKMRNTLKEYRQTLLSGMRFRVKIAFLAAIYIPPTAHLVFWYQRLRRAKK